MNRSISFYLGAGAIIVLFLIVAGYAYFRSRDYRDGPVITVSSPLANETVATSTVDVSGTVANATAVTLDDRTIFLDTHGAFDEKLLVPIGYTIISIKAEDRFGRSAEKRIGIVRSGDQ